jgi:mannitol/fructose-specific phosphotransferase system IIA component (Ntr-type)
MIATHGLRVDRAAFLETFLARERESSTCVGEGLAIPHGILAEGSQMIGVMGISRRGLQLDTPDGRPVHCMVLLATPESQRERHLEVIATLARTIGRDPVIQERLFSAKTPAHAYEILHGEESEGFNYYLTDPVAG